MSPTVCVKDAWRCLVRSSEAPCPADGNWKRLPLDMVLVRGPRAAEAVERFSRLPKRAMLPASLGCPRNTDEEEAELPNPKSQPLPFKPFEATGEACASGSAFAPMSRPASHTQMESRKRGLFTWSF